ncbi:hypothetical protein ACJ41O_013598 [Fusarium nematophilum]
MAPASSKANYKTYEAQARMVRAIVAAHPDVKWNYKEIVACYGSDMTEHALNHRFRRVRAQANIIQVGREQGLDIKDLTTDENVLPGTQGSIEKRNIAKYFGQSTADGIQFQFRTIKKDAEALRRIANEGGDVANCLSLGSGTSTAPGTPSKPTPGRGSQPGSRSGKGAKRKVAVPIPSPMKRSMSDDEDEDKDIDWSDMDVNTPSKRVKTTGRPKSATPSRSAAVKAAATIADATAQLQSSESPPEEVATPTGFGGGMGAAHLPSASVAPTSIFGDVGRKNPPQDFLSGRGTALEFFDDPSALYPDPFSQGNNGHFGLSHSDTSYMDDYGGGDGEI